MRRLYDSARHAGVSNFLVVAIDEHMHAWAKEQAIPVYFLPQQAYGSHKISAKKFGILVKV